MREPGAGDPDRELISEDEGRMPPSKIGLFVCACSNQ